MIEYFTLKSIQMMFGSTIEDISNYVQNSIRHIVSNRLLEYQVNEYNENYFIKTILHRAYPIELLSVYYPLSVKFSVISERTRKERDQKTGEFVNKVDYVKEIKREKIGSITKFFEKNKKITIVGPAGCGKSTVVRYLFLKAIDEKFKYPIIVKLRRLNDYGGKLDRFIKNEIFLVNKIGLTENHIDKLLLPGNFVFFLDGYDELHSDVKELATNEINSFVKKYSNNHFMITSRPYANIDLLPSFTNYSLQYLDVQEMPNFVKKQLFRDRKNISDKIIFEISRKENKSYLAYLRVPLMLSMFILTFQENSKIPIKRSTFYNQVFDTLFYQHDSLSKLSFVREKKSGLSKEVFEYVLAQFAFISFFAGKYLFEIDYLETTITQIKKRRNIDFSVKGMIDDLQVAIGILIKDGIYYTFPHKSLQEYFAATYTLSLSKSKKEKFYQRINEKHEQYFVSSYDNFFSILREIDELSFKKKISAPLAFKCYEAIRTRDHNQIVSYLSILLELPYSLELGVNRDDLFSVVSGVGSSDSIYNYGLQAKLDNIKKVLAKYLKQIEKWIDENENIDDTYIDLI